VTDWKGLERKRLVILPGVTRGNYEKTVIIAGNEVEIRTAHFLNKNLYTYNYRVSALLKLIIEKLI
jgi:hypothetical protein